MRKWVLVLVAASVAWGPAHADERSDAVAVLDKAIKAAGGEERLAKVKAATWKGKGKYFGVGGGVDVSGEWALQGPDHFRADLQMVYNEAKLHQVRVLNGDKGWIKGNDAEAEAMGAEALAEERKQAAAQWAVLVLLPLKDPAVTLAPAGEAKVGDKPAVVIRATPKDGREVRLYFDKDAGLLLEVEAQVKDPRGKEVKQEVFYDDYKETDGVKRAMKVRIDREGKPFVELELSESKPLEKLDDKTFEKP
jgi:hypothetical protein